MSAGHAVPEPVTVWLSPLALPSPESYALTRTQECYSACSVTALCQMFVPLVAIARGVCGAARPWLAGGAAAAGADAEPGAGGAGAGPPVVRPTGG
jgi:hypothetical protein